MLRRVVHLGFEVRIELGSQAASWDAHSWPAIGAAELEASHGDILPVRPPAEARRDHPDTQTRLLD